MHFTKKSGRLSSAGPEILVFVGRCSVKFQSILDCFMANFKYEDSENIKADRVNTVIFNSHQSNVGVLLGHPVELQVSKFCNSLIML